MRMLVSDSWFHVDLFRSRVALEAENPRTSAADHCAVPPVGSSRGVSGYPPVNPRDQQCQSVVGSASDSPRTAPCPEKIFHNGHSTKQTVETLPRRNSRQRSDHKCQ